MRRKPVHFTSCPSLSPGNLVPGGAAVQEKRKLIPEPLSAYPNTVAVTRFTPKLGCGNLSALPFENAGETAFEQLPVSLRTD